MKLKILLKDLLNDRGLTQKDLADMTGIRQAAISKMSKGFIERINIDHIERIAEALELEDINQIITLDKTRGEAL